MRKFAVSRPFPLEGTFNFRELGGYAAADGTIVTGRFYRSDTLTRLSETDRDWMRSRDITCVIDLRRPEEIAKAPDALSDDFEYHSVSLSDRLYDEDGNQIFLDCLSNLYRAILDTHQSQFAAIMNIIAARGKRPLVFHCTAGKDRTGLTAMLLLALAGVPEDIIVADYAPSGANMIPLFAAAREELRKEGRRVPEFMFESPAEEMQRTLAYINERWGSPRQYLLQCGVAEDKLEQIRQNMLA